MNIVETLLQQHDLTQFGVTTPLCSLILTPRFPASRHVVFLLMPPDQTDPVLVAKVPRLKEVSDSVEREAANLRAIQALRPEGFDTIPRLVTFEPYQGVPILVETALAGPLMSPAVVRRSADRCIGAVVDWLVDLHQVAAPAEGWFDHLAERSISYLEQNLPAEDKPLLARLRHLLQPLNKANLPFVVEHGDLSHPNLIMMRSGKVGIVDWELSEVQGLIAYDLFFFLSYVAFSMNYTNESGEYVKVFERSFFKDSSWATPYVQRYFDQTPVHADMLPPLFALCWTRYLSNLLMRLSVGDVNNETGQADPAALEQLRSNRYYAIWQYTITNIHQLALSISS